MFRSVTSSQPSTFPSAIYTVLLNAGIGLACVLLITLGLGAYGYVLFMVLPTVIGVVTVVMHGRAARRAVWQFFVIGLVSIFLLFLTMLLLPLEGAICLLMAAPLWIACTMIGVAIMLPVHLSQWPRMDGPRGFPLWMLAVVALLPIFMGAEYIADPQPPLIAVTTSVDIDAPPEIVWQNVIAFPELPEPREWSFRLGVAYPTHALIVGHGPGAVRHCVFSTGAFVEPITRWEENSLLAFDVTSSPPSMREWSLYENLNPPHVEGYLMSRRGQFRLIPLPDGRTRLEGTTWYQNNMFPVSYWQFWSDGIIHQIHGRVLRHIQSLAEKHAHKTQ